jgi:hypothetical protein
MKQLIGDILACVFAAASTALIVAETLFMLGGY